MLGSAIVSKLLLQNTFEVFVISNSNFISNEKVSLITIQDLEKFTFDVFFHCAAEVNVNLCERNFEHALKANSDYTSLLFNKVFAKKYFYISTDSIYEGIYGNYTEIDSPKPLNNYSKSKLNGEIQVQLATNKYYIVRTNIFGKYSKSKSSLFEWAESEFKQGNHVNGFTNVFFNPLYVGHLTEVLFEILHKNLEFGVYNVGCSEYISKYDFLVKVADFFGISQNFVVPTNFNFPNDVAPRPLNTTLNCKKLIRSINGINLSIERSFSLLNEDLTIKT